MKPYYIFIKFALSLLLTLAYLCVGGKSRRRWEIYCAKKQEDPLQVAFELVEITFVTWESGRIILLLENN